MLEKLLLVDIGNTCIKLVFASPGALEASYSLPTRAQHTPDSLGLALLQLLTLRGLAPESITACAVCSVVPDVNSLFRDACRKYLGMTPLSFPEDFSFDLANGYERPQEVGADRLHLRRTILQIHIGNGYDSVVFLRRCTVCSARIAVRKY